MTNICILSLTAVERKLLTLLEEIKQQGRTVILLQQQILNARTMEGRVPAKFDGHLPASTTEELRLVDTEAVDKETQSSLVCSACIS